MRRGLVISLLLLVPAVVLFIGYPFIRVLEIRNDDNGKVLRYTRMRLGEEFILSFTHSVNKRPVYDTLRVKKDYLVIVKSRFDAFGAGMPDSSTKEGTLTLAQDGWLEWITNRPVPEITVRVGWTADHKLHFKDKEIRLSDLSEPGTPVTLRVCQIRILDFIRDGLTP